MVYVLTTLFEKEERPVAVTDAEEVAEQWIREGKHNNWIPFEINDLSMTGLVGHIPFRPKKQPPAEIEMKKREQQQKQIQQLTEAVKNLIETNKYLENI